MRERAFVYVSVRAYINVCMHSCCVTVNLRVRACACANLHVCMCACSCLSACSNAGEPY